MTQNEAVMLLESSGRAVVAIAGIAIFQPTVSLPLLLPSAILLFAWAALPILQLEPTVMEDSPP